MSRKEPMVFDPEEELELEQHPDPLPRGELAPDDRGQDEVREALEESEALGEARPLTRDERDAAAHDTTVVNTVYAPASERVPRPPLPADEKLINQGADPPPEPGSPPR